MESKTSFRNTALLAAGCCVVMMHFVFSRAFRDSMLGSSLPVAGLPRLIVLGTLLSLLFSFGLSWALRRLHRTAVIAGTYFAAAGGELLLAQGAAPPALAPSAFYVLISLSTALGLSLLWLLANDWFSRAPEIRARAIPLLLTTGTAGGLAAGFGLVHLHAVGSFRSANLILASMNAATGLLLLGYRQGPAAKEQTSAKSLSRLRVRRQRIVVVSLAAATVLGASASTLLDLTYRIAASEHYHSQPQLLHFFGYLQALLGVAAIAAQLGLSRWQPSGKRRSLMAVYALAGAVFAGLAAVFPSFALLTVMRTGEYAMRNSLFRFGTEITYSELPRDLRQQTRPIIDTVGERVGDSVAAGLLQLFFLLHHSLPLRLVLLSLSAIALVLWKVCEQIAHLTEGRRAAREARLPSSRPAVLAYAPSPEKGVDA